MISDLSQTAIGRGFSIQIFPFEEEKWGVIELNLMGSSLRVQSDRHNLYGDGRISDCYDRFRSIKVEMEASSGNMKIFDSFEYMEDWLKKKCNKLWPMCGYCNVRYIGDEVVCRNCGGPRGE